MSNGTESDNLCRREVTASNWNVKQTVSIAAKLDFKYDGVQQRNLTVWIRKEDVSGQTFERRSIKVYTVGICRCSYLFLARCQLWYEDEKKMQPVQ